MRTVITGTRSRGVVVALTALAVLALASCMPVRAFKASNPPNNAQDRDFSWFVAPAAQPGKQVMIGLTRAGPPDPDRPAMLLIHGYDGLNRDYMSLARELRAASFDVAIGCWSYAGTPVDASDPLIQCPVGPTPPGVSAPAVAEVDRLVSATRQALANPGANVTVIGFSAGGGVAALRNSLGRTEPTVSIAGLLQGVSAYGRDAGGIDVTTPARAATFAAPALLVHGTDDGLIPVGQSQALEAALLAVPKPVAAWYPPDTGHGLLQVPAVRAKVVLLIAAWALDPLAPIDVPTDVTATDATVTGLDPAVVAAVEREVRRNGTLAHFEGL